jgi:hypothetical protein
MYGLPEGLDLSFFVGKALSTIAFAISDIHFAFEDKVAIRLESSSQHQQKVEGDSFRIGVMQSLPLIHSSLMSLLELSVTEVHGDEKGTLSLTFSDGQVLRFFDDNTAYEAYSFSDGENEYFV